MSDELCLCLGTVRVHTCIKEETVVDGEASRCKGWLVGSEARLLGFGGMFGDCKDSTSSKTYGRNCCDDR